MLFVSGILVFGVTNSYAQDFSQQNLDFINLEEMKMLIHLPSTWKSTFQNGVIHMMDTQNPDIVADAGAIPPHASTPFPSDDSPLNEVAKNIENYISSLPGFVQLLGSYEEPSLNAHSIYFQYKIDDLQMFDATIYKISDGNLYYLIVTMPAEIAQENMEIVSFLTTYFVVGEEYDSMH
ncbi:MAG TPA: hypothetical protein VLA74_05085 [Nitrososphaeraceae archaeon]|nr:hypothetical protein [Nitrososphaeraceae archaeon]